MTTEVSPVARYARGFVLSAAPVPIPVSDWTSTEVVGLFLARAPEVSVASARSGGASLTVIGPLVDPASWMAPADAIAAAAAALVRSEDAFLDVTDAWSGRYLVLFGSAGSRSVMTDATGVRAAFYPLEGPLVVASHARIVARAVGAAQSPLDVEYNAHLRSLRSPVVMPRPGRSTPWDGVVILPANQVLDLDTRVLRRIFPRRPIAPLTTTEAAAWVAPRLQGQVTELVALGRPVIMSLTAGIDSRTSV